MIIDYELLGNKIRYYRTQKGISQEELAGITDVSRVFIGFIERGEKKPSLETLIVISNALNVPVDELLSNELLTAAPSDFTLFNETTIEEKEILLQTVTALKEVLHKYRIIK